MKKLILLSTLLLVSASAVSHADVMVLKSSKDNPLSSGTGNDLTNKGWGGLAYTEANETLLLQFDLASLNLAPNQVVESATLELFSGHLGGYHCDWRVTALPMRVAWEEGHGVPTDGFGGIGFPWGPVSVGDATHKYRQVTAVGAGTGAFATQIVAAAGIPWEVAGGRGTTQDAYPRTMIDQNVVLPQAAYPPGTSLALLNLTAEGVAVLNEWLDGTLPNNGMVVMQQELASGSNWRLAMREFGETLTSVPSDFAPTLRLTIGTRALVGDVDGDGHVDVIDLLFLADTWAKSLGDEGFNPQCDFNHDNSIDVVDLLMLAENWGL